MHLGTKISTTGAARATATLNDRVKAILADYNQNLLERDAEERDTFPDKVIKDTPHATIADVVKCLSATRLTGGYGLSDYDAYDTLEAIVEALAMQVAANEYDPWPELTMGELRFLVGDRASSASCPYPLNLAVMRAEDRPLTFMERVCADRHREWLGKGIEAKRKRLRKAQAVIAKLAGEAA